MANAKLKKPFTVGDASVLVTNEYFAASGRECRSIEITRPNQQIAENKIVCNFDGTWGYTLDVLPSSFQQ